MLRHMEGFFQWKEFCAHHLVTIHLADIEETYSLSGDQSIGPMPSIIQSVVVLMLKRREKVLHAKTYRLIPSDAAIGPTLKLC